MEKIRQIPLASLKPAAFIRDQVAAIAEAVGTGVAVNTLSGGVDSSVVTLLGHRALGARLKTCFIENGIMREGEAKRIAALFRRLGVKVEVIDARKQFYAALAGIDDPEASRSARPSRRPSTRPCSGRS
jgi:GMP synthase (glutamine-hydrolysing)